MLYGLEIVRRLEYFSDLTVTEGTIYPLLGRLAARGGSIRNGRKRLSGIRAGITR
jgi:DNA-binding PadR family transcriptional regulator